MNWALGIGIVVGALLVLGGAIAWRWIKIAARVLQLSETEPLP